VLEDEAAVITRFLFVNPGRTPVSPVPAPTPAPAPAPPQAPAAAVGPKKRNQGRRQKKPAKETVLPSPAPVSIHGYGWAVDVIDYPPIHTPTLQDVLDAYARQGT
jgi:hypothetical protein